MNLKLLLFITGVLLVLRWNSFTAPFERDEGEYAYDARVLLDGGLPYHDSNSQKPPLIFYTYAVGELINPSSIWPPRLLAFIFEVLTIFLVSLTAKHLWGRRAAWAAAPIFALMLNFPPLAPFAANTEIFALLPLTLVLYLYIKHGADASKWVLLVAGFAAAASILYKPIVIYMLLFIFASWFWKKRTLATIVTIVLGGLTAAVLTLGYFAYRDGLKTFWEFAISFNAAYAAQYGWGLGNLFSRLGSFFNYWWVILLLTGWYLVRPGRSWWLAGLIICGLLAVYSSPIGHYYLIIMPAWALVVTFSLINLADFLKTKDWWPGSFWYLVMITIALMIYPIRQQFILSPRQLVGWIYGDASPFLESELVAEKLAKVTTPDDRVFIAGSEPQILHYANRKSVSRFVTTYALVMDTPKRLAYQKEAQAALEAHPPAAIVVSRGEDSGLYYQNSPQKDQAQPFVSFLDNLLAKNYRLVGGFVWGVRGGQSQDTLSDADIKNASLLLYKKAL